MSFIPMTQRVADVTDNGEPVFYYEATHESGDTLPTDNVYQGSWSMNLTDKSVVFFNADTEEWV